MCRRVFALLRQPQQDKIVALHIAIQHDAQRVASDVAGYVPANLRFDSNVIVTNEQYTQRHVNSGHPWAYFAAVDALKSRLNLLCLAST